MRIVADKVIMGVSEAFESLGEVETFSASEINEMTWDEIDVLLVRSKCPVTKNKLDGTNLRFVGTATAGFDHFDHMALDSCNTTWGNAPGCNAESVVDFVMATLSHFTLRSGEDFRNKQIGIVGCGQVGGRLAKRLSSLDVKLHLCDPPLREKGSDLGAPWKTLSETLKACDILSLHVPLTTSGPNPTKHLIDSDELESLGSDAWLINASRGAVISNAKLLEQLPFLLGLDVWENEPLPNPDLIQVSDIATAHVAGHSVQGKLNGTYQLYQQVCALLGYPESWHPDLYLQKHNLVPPTHVLDASCSAEKIFQLAVDAYDLDQDDKALRDSTFARLKTNRGERFQTLRNDYRTRHDFKAQLVQCPDPHLHSMIKGFGFKVG